MVRKFGIDEEAIQVTDERDRLKRPVAVAIFGTLISLGMVALIFARSGGQGGGGEIGIMVFGVLACAMSCLYAFLGARYSKALANRALGLFGSVIALAGVGFVIWMLLAYGP